jgi:epoxide hydrolase-like predicted phosphatase
VIYRLDQAHYERMRPLFRALEFHLTSAAVLDGNNPGQVFVDDLTEPQSAFMASPEGCYLAGRSDNDAFNRALSQTILRPFTTSGNVLMVSAVEGSCMAIQAIFFDVGGVLIRVENYDKRHEWEARLGLPREQATRSVFDSEAAERAILGEIPEEELWQDVGRRLGLSADQLASFRLDFWKSEMLDLELVLLIRTVRPRYKVGIISNAWSDARVVLNRKFSLDSLVDDVIYSAEVKLAKPDARIFQLALKRLDVHAKEAVFVDDMLGNVQAAQALGMKGVQFKNTEQTITEIKEHLDEHPTT